MKKEKQYIPIVLTSPFRTAQLLFSLGLLTFLFTLYSFALMHHPSDLSPVWLPTAVMMAGFYRFKRSLWPGIALAGALGVIAATSLYSPSAVTLTYPAINILEALVGALLLRRWLVLDNPLQNLVDWTRMAIACALVPALLGGILVASLSPGTNALQTLIVWAIAEATGALALVPIGLLLKARFATRYQNTSLL